MTFNIYTLGCKVNTYESNAIIDILKEEGYKLVDTKDKSDITIINTCTVTNTADNKSLKTIKHAIKNNGGIIVVMGCLTQVSAEIVKSIEGVSIIVGNRNKTFIPRLIEKYLQTKEQIVEIKDLTKESFEPMQIIDFNKTRAFVKIQDGCNNYCSYCIIPYSRGNVCSKKHTDVIKEIKNLVKNGYKEIVLTGIHTGHYGEDLTNYSFYDLLKEILEIKGLERLRITSIEMNEITDDIIELIKNNHVLVDHMHIPLQSGSNQILKLMNRKYLKEDFIEKIDKLRIARPTISITTDLIVGFPYETEELFNETIETINQIKFSKIHVFPYSRRKGTVASEMPNQIDERVKKERVRKIIDISKDLEIEYMNKFVGKEMYILPETIKNGYLYGHTTNYLNVKVKSDKKLNNLIKVKIEKVEYPYCIGYICE